MSNKNKMMKWIEKSLETDKFLIEDMRSGQNGDGYIGDLNFVKVIVNDPKEKNKELFLVVKLSKNDESIQDFSSVLCKIEVDFYSEVFPVLEKFLQEKNVKQPFNSVPKCYKAFFEENTFIVVIEDLKVKGYEMQHTIQPMNLNIIKLVFKSYAKFHAISFALSDQRKDIFKQMEGKLKNSLESVIEQFKTMYDKYNVTALNFLIEDGHKDLAQKLGKLMEKGIYYNAKNCLSVIPEERVVVHGDCHCQNLLFKFQDGDRQKPLAVAFLDFQISGIHSPMTDLGYFWYCAVQNKEQCSHFRELMEFYYKELSSSVAELGSDIRETFPISKMWEHWEKYSLYGFNQSVAFIHIFYSEKTMELADMMDSTKGPIRIKMNDKNKSLYLERLVAVVDHYFNFKIN